MGNHYHYTTVKSTVTEQRAPTDESVQLLREMEDAALGNVVHRLKLQDNIFGEVLVMQEPFTQSVVVCFKLNGKPYKVSLDDRTIMLAKSNPHSYAQALFDELAKAIAEEFFIKYAKDL